MVDDFNGQRSILERMCLLLHENSSCVSLSEGDMSFSVSVKFRVEHVNFFRSYKEVRGREI